MRSGSRNHGLFVAAIAVSAVGLLYAGFFLWQHAGREPQRMRVKPDYFPSPLFVADGAADVWYEGPIPGQPNEDRDIYSVSYSLELPHPATEFIDQIEPLLVPLGWSRLDYDLLNPQFPANPGWFQQPFKMDGRTYQSLNYMENWVHPSGDIIFISLSYYPEGPREATRSPDSLWVTWIYNGPNSWAQKAATQYRKMHPQEQHKFTPAPKQPATIHNAP